MNAASARRVLCERLIRWGVGLIGAVAVGSAIYLAVAGPGAGPGSTTTYVAPNVPVQTSAGGHATATGTATLVEEDPGTPARGSDAVDTALLTAGAVLLLCAMFYWRITKLTVGGVEIDLSLARAALADPGVSQYLASARIVAPDDGDSDRGDALDDDLKKLAKITPTSAAVQAASRLDTRLLRVEREVLEVRMLRQREPAKGERWLGGHWTVDGLVSVGALSGASADFCNDVLALIDRFRRDDARPDQWGELFELIDAAWALLSPPLLFRARVTHDLRARGYKVTRADDQPSRRVADLLVNRPGDESQLRIAARAAMNPDHVWLDKGVVRLARTKYGGRRAMIVPTTSCSLAGLQGSAQVNGEPAAANTGLRVVKADGAPTAEETFTSRLTVEFDSPEAPAEFPVATLAALRSTIDAMRGDDPRPPAIDALVERLQSGPTIQLVAS